MDKLERAKVAQTEYSQVPRKAMPIVQGHTESNRDCQQKSETTQIAQTTSQERSGHVRARKACVSTMLVLCLY